MTSADLIQIRLNHQWIQNGSLRKGNLPGCIWHGFGDNSLSTVAVEKNDANQKRSINRNVTNCAARTTCRTHWFGQKDGLLMHVFTSWYEKISLDNNQRQWVVNCIRQSKKSNEQFDLPAQGGKFELDLSMVFLCERKELLAYECVALTRLRISGQFLVPDRINSFNWK